MSYKARANLKLVPKKLASHYYQWIEHYPCDGVKLTIIVMEFLRLRGEAVSAACVYLNDKDGRYSQDVNEIGDCGTDGKIDCSPPP